MHDTVSSIPYMKKGKFCEPLLHVRRNCLKPVSRCECRLTHKKFALTKRKTADNDGAKGQNCLTMCTAYKNTQQMALLLGPKGLSHVKGNPAHHAAETEEQDPT